MKRRLAVLAAVASVLAGVPALAPSGSGAPLSPAPALAKSCSSSFVRGTINGSVKCLRRGQFCAHAADAQYRRYGFRCTKYYSNVARYRLT